MENLVSICVVTYNSEKYILQTLESIKNQTYKNIELIISDDCSKDNTVTIVQDWININKNRFVSAYVLTVEKNTGVTANCNRALRKSNGVYVKTLGDDLLKPLYLEKCINYFENHNDCSVLCTTMDYFFSEGKFNFEKPEIQKEFFFLSANEQFEWIKKKNIPLYPTPSVIYKRDIFDKLGEFDERIPMWEDGPFYFKLAKNGIKVWLITENLLKYRLLPRSLSNHIPKSHKKSISRFYVLYYFRYDLKNNFIRALLKLLKHSFIGFIKL